MGQKATRHDNRLEVRRLPNPNVYRTPFLFVSRSFIQVVLSGNGKEALLRNSIGIYVLLYRFYALNNIINRCLICLQRC